MEDIKKVGDRFLGQSNDRKTMGSDEKTLAETLVNRSVRPPERVTAGKYLMHPRAPLSNEGKQVVDTFKGSPEPRDREIVQEVEKHQARA